MADLPAYPDSTGDIGDIGDTGVRPGRRSTTSMPRWVYVFGIIVIVLVLLVVFQHLIGGAPMHHTM